MKKLSMLFRFLLIQLIFGTPAKLAANPPSGEELSDKWQDWNPNMADAKLGEEVEALKQYLTKDRELQKRIKDTPSLRAYYVQVLTQLQHVSFSFEIRDRTYTHDFVLEDAYPRQPSLIAIRKARDFLRIIKAPTALVSENPEKAQIVELAPAELQAREEALLESQKSLIREVSNNSLETYNEMSERLKKFGPEASFSKELGPVAEHLALQLAHDDVVKKLAASDPVFAEFRNSVLLDLQRVKKTDAGVEYPYVSTLESIQRAVEFFDIVRRADDPTRSPKLYHSHRYEYYGHYLKSKIPDHITLPTLVSLGATDILKTRGVPIGLIGVNTDVTWVDGFWQTPYEFWIHDINHSRRMFQFFSEAAEAQGLSVEEFAKVSDKFVKEKLMPLISISKKDQQFVASYVRKVSQKPPLAPTQEESEAYARANKKRLLKVLLFEILHEDALAAAPEIVKNATLRPPNLITPFEYIDGNKVVYIMEPGATTLAYTYRKLAHDFYDMPGARIDNIVAPEFRTREYIVEAAETLFKELGFKVRREVLEYFVSTDQGFPKDFKQTVEEDIRNRPGETVALDQEVSLEKKTSRQLVADSFHELWQKNSGYLERWKPARVAFKDGRGINDGFVVNTQEQLDEYLAEREIPVELHKYYSFRLNPVNGERMLFEDIQHIPQEYLAPNNQFENIQAGYDAVRIAEALHEQRINFEAADGRRADLQGAMNWFKDRFQEMNLEWLRRNGTWAKSEAQYTRDWSELPSVRQSHAVRLIRLALEVENQLDPSKFSATQASLFEEALRRIELEIRQKAEAELRVALAGDKIHELWQKRTRHVDRWKVAMATLWDGTPVSNEALLESYFVEKKIPQELRKFFRFKLNAEGRLTLEEDIKHLPNKYLAANHQTENQLAGEKAIGIVRRYWERRLDFKNLDSAERWLTAAAQEVHAAVLLRNNNGAFDNSEYSVHWIDLPAINKLHDLDHVKAAFEARFQLYPQGISEEQKMLILGSLARIESKIGSSGSGKSCRSLISIYGASTR